MSEQTIIISSEELSESERDALAVVREFCASTGLAIEPVVHGVNPPYMDVELMGEDSLNSFGKSGKALDSLQYLLNLIIGRRVSGDVRIALDAAGYRARRIVILEALARECAENVIERQEECELDPLPAHERRIVHNILQQYPEIRTYSEGEDPDRHVVIAPKE